MKQYLELLKDIRDNGHDHPDRTGTGRRSVFGRQLRFNLQDGFPLVTTRQIFTRGMIEELLWFISGSSNNKELTDKKVNIWKPWAVTEEHIAKHIIEHMGDTEATKVIANSYKEIYEHEIGPIYGPNWRNIHVDRVHMFWPKVKLEDIPSDKLSFYREQYQHIVKNHETSESKEEIMSEEDYCSNMYRGNIDQLNNLIISLKNNPYSARHIVTAWIPQVLAFEELSPQDNVLTARGALAPCHMMFQCFVSPAKTEGGKLQLSLQLYQRSTDAAIGFPYNIAQYSLLLMLLAHVVNMEPYEFIWTTGDTHIYLNQLEKVDIQLAREPKPLCHVVINKEVKSLFDFKVEDIIVVNYLHHEPIAYEISV